MTEFTFRSFDRYWPDLSEAAVLITGGTGSFGRALARNLLSRGVPRRLVIYSRDEQKQEKMERELRSEFPAMADRLRFFIGDVRDVSRLEIAMHDIDTVIHAAALKIVPTAEYNPFECILTNVHGAENVVMASLRTGVKKIMALSTDKAANPINLYGASKLASDKIMVAANNFSGSRGICFSVVRYGNVIGSRGSVLPLFNNLISRGADYLPITDPRMTRFWITLTQGIEFVMSSLGLMQGGEIFVPKIPSMRIIDLANAIAPGLPHKMIGIRPGEKLHEVLVTEDDARMTLEMDDRYVIHPPHERWRPDVFESMGAKPAAEGFCYSSVNNTEWVTVDALVDLIKCGMA